MQSTQSTSPWRPHRNRQDNEKDIFVDAHVAKNFSHPLSKDYQEFLKWLWSDGALVLNKRLIAEYGRQVGTNRPSTGDSIITLLNFHLSEGWVSYPSNNELKEFRLKKKDLRMIRCDGKDYDHLKSIFLSRRRLAITRDNGLFYDVNNLSLGGKRGQAAKKPSEINYR